jgi:hypothetical protein
MTKATTSRRGKSDLRLHGAAVSTAPLHALETRTTPLIPGGEDNHNGHLADRQRWKFRVIHHRLAGGLVAGEK